MRTKKFKYEAPIGMFIKRHYCPYCSSVLITKKVRKLVNSKSEEAKDFDFSTDAGEFPGYLTGDVEFIWYVYHCANCDIEITNREMREILREKKGKKAKNKEERKGSTIGFVLFIAISIALLMLYSYSCDGRYSDYFERKIEDMGLINRSIPIKYVYSANPFYVHLKKHYCPRCNGVMKAKYNSIIVNSNSPEAEFYDFSLPDSRLIGDVEFRVGFFVCEDCDYEISFDEMKRLEADKQ